MQERAFNEEGFNYSANIKVESSSDIKRLVSRTHDLKATFETPKSAFLELSDPSALSFESFSFLYRGVPNEPLITLEEDTLSISFLTDLLPDKEISDPDLDPTSIYDPPREIKFSPPQTEFILLIDRSEGFALSSEKLAARFFLKSLPPNC
jgi:hypothetical protein